MCSDLGTAFDRMQAVYDAMEPDWTEEDEMSTETLTCCYCNDPITDDDVWDQDETGRPYHPCCEDEAERVDEQWGPDPADDLLERGPR